MTNIYKKNLYNSWLMLCCSMIKSIISISCILSLHNILVRLFDPIFIIWKLFWLELTQIDLRLAWIGGKLWAGKTLTGRWGFMRQRLPIQDLNQRILITQKIQCIYIYILILMLLGMGNSRKYDKNVPLNEVSNHWSILMKRTRCSWLSPLQIMAGAAPPELHIFRLDPSEMGSKSVNLSSSIFTVSNIVFALTSNYCSKAQRWNLPPFLACDWAWA